MKETDKEQSIHTNFSCLVSTSFLFLYHSPGCNGGVVFNRTLPWLTWPQSATSGLYEPIQLLLIVFSWLENDQEQHFECWQRPELLSNFPFSFISIWNFRPLKKERNIINNKSLNKHKSIVQLFAVICCEITVTLILFSNK